MSMVPFASLVYKANVCNSMIQITEYYLLPLSYSSSMNIHVPSRTWSKDFIFEWERWGSSPHLFKCLSFSPTRWINSYWYNHIPKFPWKLSLYILKIDKMIYVINLFIPKTMSLSLKEYACIQIYIYIYFLL